MSVAKCLPPVDPHFMQPCPLCGTPQRMMIKGNYIHQDQYEKFPDMGYSFCNCHHIFFTKWENVTKGEGWNSLRYPHDELIHDFHDMDPGQTLTISMLDPYFINWNSPHNMWHWNCRKVYILWDMDSFCQVAQEIGFHLVSAQRDMDVESKTPQHFHIKLMKPEVPNA